MLVTTDKGFCEHRNEQHYGILLVRLRQPNKERIHARIIAAFQQYTDSDWPSLRVEMRDEARSVYKA